MADNIKVSELAELTSGSLSDNSIFPIVDGGSTKKTKLSSLQSYLTDDLATDAELSQRIATVNATINALNTDDISEGSTNLYLNNAGVDVRLNAKSVVSSSAQIAGLGYITSQTDSQTLSFNVGSSVLSISSGNSADLSSLVGGEVVVAQGTVSSSAQTIKNLGGSTIVSGSLTSTDIGDFSTAVSTSAASSGFGAGGGGGGGSSDYISDIAFAGSTLTFTNVGSAFGSTIDLSEGDLAASSDLNGKLAVSTYLTDSSSFASRVGGGGGGGSVPSGTVSSSAQTIENINTIGAFSSSNQVIIRSGDFTNFTTDEITEGTINKFGTNANILTYINSIGVASGSGGGGFDVSGTNVVSSSVQITNLGFIDAATYGAGTASIKSTIDGIDAGVNLNDINVFLAKQKFTQGLEVTGSMILTGGSYSGSGAQLFGIPAAAIDGLAGASSIADGDNNVTVDNVQGVTATIGAGNFNVNLTEGTNLIISGGYAIASSGSWFSGSGQGLTGIPGSAIEGGVDGQKIFSGSFSASIESTLVGADLVGSLRVNVPAVFDSTISASGELTAQSISIGSGGTPTIYSANNLNLSASNAVVVTDSPLRLNPFVDATTGSFTLQPGDMTFNSTSNDFYGYRIVNQTGSWYSLTEGTVTELEWGAIIGYPQGLVSASSQISSLGGGLISSSGQILPISASSGTIYYEDTLDNMSGSSDFVYTAGTRTLNVNKVIANEIVYNTSLSGAGNDTGSYGRVETDALIINSAIEFPQSDGTPNQVLKTDGGGQLAFAGFATLLGNDNLTTTGTMTMGTGSINTSLSVGTELTVGGTNEIQIAPLTTFIETTTATIQSVNNITLDTSASVVINDVLSLTPRTDNPTNPLSGSLISKTVGGVTKPYFWDGLVWTALY